MIRRLLLIAIAGVTAIALVSALAAPAASDANRLSIRTGPGLEMKLKRAGKEVDYIPRGRHTITVRDTSRAHSVQIRGLDGPASSYSKNLSSLRFVGMKTVTVVLREGRHMIWCWRHKARMADYFQVE